MNKDTCKICCGVMWVCSKHSLLPYSDLLENACQCSEPEPCRCNPGGKPQPTFTIEIEGISADDLYGKRH